MIKFVKSKILQDLIIPVRGRRIVTRVNLNRVYGII